MFQWLLIIAALWGFANPSSSTIEERWNIAYKQEGPRTLRLNICLPRERTEPVPAVVFVHGGLWWYMTRWDYRDFCQIFARNGVAGVSIDFRSFPNADFGDQVRDIKDSIRWVRKHAGACGIDPDRIGLYGSSSGGHLAGLAGLSGDGEGFGDDPPGESSQAQALFMLYGAYDLRNLEGSIYEPLMRLFIGADEEERPDLYELYSPITHLDGAEPPTFILHGADDSVVQPEQAQALVDALDSVGVSAQLTLWEGLGHGFVQLRPWLRPKIAETALAFFQDVL